MKEKKRQFTPQKSDYILTLIISAVIIGALIYGVGYAGGSILDMLKNTIFLGINSDWIFIIILLVYQCERGKVYNRNAVKDRHQME